METKDEKSKIGAEQKPKRARKPKLEKPEAPQKPFKKLHEVIVNGRVRELTRHAYEAISKDTKNFDVELPEGSLLTKKPCKNC